MNITRTLALGLIASPLVACEAVQLGDDREFVENPNLLYDLAAGRDLTIKCPNPKAESITMTAAEFSNYKLDADGDPNVILLDDVTFTTVGTPISGATGTINVKDYPFTDNIAIRPECRKGEYMVSTTYYFQHPD